MVQIRTALFSAAITLALALAAYFAFTPAPARAASAASSASQVHMYTNEYLRQWAQQNQAQP
jgi:hypothetical protein